MTKIDRRSANRITEEMRQRGQEKRKALRAARGASYGALVTLIVMQEIVKRSGQRELRREDMIAATGLEGSSVSGQLRQLVEAGYIEKRGRGRYTLARAVDMTVLPSKRRAQARELIAKLPASRVEQPLALSAFSAATAPQVSEAAQAALDQAMKALAPFARFGARVVGKPSDAVPLLMRRDGLTNASFIAAHEAREAILAALGKESESGAEGLGAPSASAQQGEADELERYFAP